MCGRWSAARWFLEERKSERVLVLALSTASVTVTSTVLSLPATLMRTSSKTAYNKTLSRATKDNQHH